MLHQKKRKRQQPGRFLNILILIVTVLIVFEGKLLINIFQKDSLATQVSSQIDELFANDSSTEPESSSELPITPTLNIETEPVLTDPDSSSPSSPAIVAKQDVALTDSYFSDAVFIGDSRMEGFRNQSGITQGMFLTGIGMNSINIFTDPYITLYNEKVTVFQALYKTDYKKVYVMIGTNDLGEPDFNDFKDHYRSVLAELKKQAPNALIYVISVAYVEEAKVTTGAYVNNANIDTVNEKILELCEENGYYYLNINEVLSDGNHSLKEGATSDGIHMYDTYCKIWLDYLREHYVKEDPSAEISSEAETSASSELESETSETETN